MGRLDELPDALLLLIAARLRHLRSLCSLLCSCRALHASLSPHIPQLPRLHLLDTALPIKYLKRYLESNTTLHRLILNCSKLKKEDVLLLLKPNLQELHLQNCLDISKPPEFLHQIGVHCANLRTLTLDLFWLNDLEMVELYTASLEKMLSSLTCLESLFLRGQGGEVDARVFGVLPKLCSPSIRSLRIVHLEDAARQFLGVNGIPEDAIQVMGFRNLERLSLALSSITDHLMSILIDSVPSLSELDLEDCPSETPAAAKDLSNYGIQEVARLKNLRRLSLLRGKPNMWKRGHSPTFKRVNDLGFLLMAHGCKKLESIRLGRFSQVTDTGLNGILESCSNLQAFELIGMKQTSDLTFHDMSTMSCPLVVLSLPAANQITSDAVSQLACCSKLKFLNLAFCRSVGDRGLKALGYLRNLSVLDLSGADVTDFGLYGLSRTRSPLVSLSLRSCKRLTHAGIAALARGCLPATLQALDLSNLAVTDDTVLALIASGMEIIDLRLRDCYSITDASVAALACMDYKGNTCGGSLKVLDLLNNVGLTPNSLLWFQKPYFPRLRWLGLGKHLKSDPLARILTEGQGSMHMSFATSCDLPFGYDALTARHSYHSNASFNKGSCCGTLSTDDDEHCELCSLAL